jgi:hypothetical protein
VNLREKNSKKFAAIEKYARRFIDLSQQIGIKNAVVSKMYKLRLPQNSASKHRTLSS